MKHQYVIRPAADLDLVTHADYIAQDNPDAAERFIRAAFASIDFIANHHYAGPAYIVPGRKWVGLRKWAISGFGNYLIFYRVLEDRVEILRVIHGARDIPAALEEPD